jgi:hypothetical protein
MPFAPADLSVLAYANGFTLWHYATPDAQAAVTAAGYFDAAAAMVRPGDVVLARIDADGASPVHGFLVVSGVDAGAVSVAGPTVIGGA